ncbi:NrfD/PsrC family molybdoenzyme membrane anchor subunit [Thiomonas sp. FB-Cd]|uniref:NrfD/PsrC family molybdoenzyme membrane anchor subunit n=1 Tax=Thiomonas sp. FB-Cd TaxID=1158292 RepID=UPI0004DF1A45|nr:NrfD/PsrC family molybdoenzyme membrane anchor subunit [Thiomonas sp. FB-Cd]
MREEVLASVLANAKVEPQLAIWGWQIATYLFLGGLAAGLMVLSAWAVLARREAQAPFAAGQAPLIGFVALMVGMTTLFLDLEQKINVWRFYTGLHVTSVMSWGSWVLLLVIPALGLLTLAGLPSGFPALSAWLDRLPAIGPRLIAPISAICVMQRRKLAVLNFALGIALGIYTGVLLSAFNARPFWHSALLGPLFLTSGLSTGAAMMILGTGADGERHLFGRIDLGLILVELALIGLFLADMLNGNALQRDAAAHVLGGGATQVFWLGFIGAGLALPLALELVLWRRSMVSVAAVAAVLVLFGGFLLRDVVVKTGQETSWSHFDNQFNASLLKDLRKDGENPNGRF